MSQHSWSSARKFSWMLTVASALGVSTAAEAANVFSITGATSAFTTSDATFGSLLTSINTATDSLTATVNNTMFADATLQSLLSGMAEGASHGTKSIVADYGSNPSLFSVGAGGVFSIYPGFSSLNLGTSTGLPSFGVNAQAALSVGLSLGLFLGNRSLGPIALNRLTLYGSFMTFNTQISSLTLGMTNFSVRGQYKLFPPIGPSFLAQWGGIDVGLGVEYSTSTIGLQTALTQSVAGTDFTTTWASTFNLGLKASTFTVPVEVSTNATLLYVVTAFAGLGFDLNFGGATTYGGATGPITVNYTGALPIGSQNLYSATGTLNLEGQMNVAPSAADMRFFVGGQFNLWLLKIAGVFNYQTNSVYSGALIARVAM